MRVVYGEVQLVLVGDLATHCSL